MLEFFFIFLVIMLIIIIKTREKFQNIEDLDIDEVHKLMTKEKKKLFEEKANKELNRDFNFEEPLYYRTPYQFLDYQDLLIYE
tara:strand:+ start:484 stop:732 length:249 start_codon:yes stop_codon:yes gene_type:complete